ncbi:hypothetical protein [Nostoc sp. DedQUE08]|nr:hypothetical protein [Nostoc sp. DedQUE08]
MSQESVNSRLWDATPCAGKKCQSAIAPAETAKWLKPLYVKLLL